MPPSYGRGLFTGDRCSIPLLIVGLSVSSIARNRRLHIRYQQRSGRCGLMRVLGGILVFVCPLFWFLRIRRQKSGRSGRGSVPNSQYPPVCSSIPVLACRVSASVWTSVAGMYICPEWYGRPEWCDGIGQLHGFTPDSSFRRPAGLDGLPGCPATEDFACIG